MMKIRTDLVLAKEWISPPAPSHTPNLIPDDDDADVGEVDHDDMV